MEKSDFDKLLKRYLTGNVSDAEKVKIEAWLEVAKTEDVSGQELSRADEEKIFRKITGNIQDDKPMIELPRTGQIPVFRWALGMAAAILLIASYFIWTPTGTTSDVEKMILNDGTLVWLKGGNSKLRYYEKPGDARRYAELTGEALFEVTKDAARPFVLRCGAVTIRVLGTSFSVKTLHDSVALEVLTGLVNLSSEADQKGIDVEPHRKIVYAGQSHAVTSPMNETEVATLTTDTEYDMHFLNATLDQVLNKIEKKFEVDVKMETGKIAHCKITADFTDHSLESTMTMISEVLDISYKINGSSVTVSGSGCQ